MKKITLKPKINEAALIKILKQYPEIKSVKDIVWSIDVNNEDILLNAVSFRF